MIVDWHAHVYPPEVASQRRWGNIYPLTIENLLEAHERAGIDLCVVSNTLHYIKGSEANTQLGSTFWIEVVSKTQLCRSARGGFVDGQARDEMVDPAPRWINRNSADCRPACARRVERVGDHDVVDFAPIAETAVRPDNVDRASAVDLGRGQGTLPQTARDRVVPDCCDGGSGTPAHTAVSGVEGANCSFISIGSGHNDGSVWCNNGLPANDPIAVGGGHT